MSKNMCIVLIISYLVGNISPSYFLGKEYKHIDIREHGSGNAGSTNALRVMGKKIALIVFLVDFFKGFLVAFFVNHYFGLQNALYASLAVVIGHIYPVILGFRGGKGVATSLGVLYCLFPLDIIICSVLGLIILAAKRYVSLASMSTLFMINIALLIDKRYTLENVAVTFVIFLIVIFKHRSNIKRLINHEESKIGQKAK